MSQTTKHQNEGRHSKYFHIMLNMADDDLDPFEYRLLGHYIRICGQSDSGTCYQTLRTISEVTRMSVPKVISARTSLADKGWISVVSKQRQSTLVRVLDRMSENIAKYAGDKGDNEESRNISSQSPSDQNIEQRDQNIDHRDQYPAHKEDKNSKEEDRPEAAPPEKTTSPVRARNAGYDMVACQYLGKQIDSPAFKSLGGRIAQHAKWCNGESIRVFRKDDAGEKHSIDVPAPSSTVTPELLAGIRRRYIRDGALRFLPRDILKFVELVEEELERSAPSAEHPQVKPLTPDEMAAERARFLAPTALNAQRKVG